LVLHIVRISIDKALQTLQRVGEGTKTIRMSVTKSKKKIRERRRK